MSQTDANQRAASMDASRFSDPSFDMARLAPGPALSEADKALQDAMQSADAQTRAAYVDPARFAEPTVASNPFDAVMAPNEVAVNSALMSPTTLENVQPAAQDFAPADSTVLGPEAGLNAVTNRFTPSDVSQPTGIDSPEHQQMVANVENQLANPSISAPDPNAALAGQVTTPTVEGWSAMAAANPMMAAADPNAALSAPADVASMTTDVTAPSAVDARTEAQIAADFAQEVGAQKTARITPMDDNRMKANMGVQPLDTITVPDQPEIAAPVADPNVALSAPAITPALASTSSNPMQDAANNTLGTAMGVWNGDIQTGTATDGSTVSRLSDGTVARYNPKYDQTEYSDDEGQHWTGLTTGNKIPGSVVNPADPNVALSAPAANPVSRAVSAISPGGILGGGLLGKLVGLLSGTTSRGITSQGTDGGMRASEHGAPGAPGGSGPGGTGSSAGGYGSTGGKDPEGAY